MRLINPRLKTSIIMISSSPILIGSGCEISVTHLLQAKVNCKSSIIRPRERPISDERSRIQSLHQGHVEFYPTALKAVAIALRLSVLWPRSLSRLDGDRKVLEASNARQVGLEATSLRFPMLPTFLVSSRSEIMSNARKFALI